MTNSKKSILYFSKVATFCASLSGLIGASRVLQAVAKDTMFGPFLEFILKGTVGDNPIAAVIFTGCLSGEIRILIHSVIK